MTQSPLPQPDADQISLANVLAALGDQTRLAIIGHLARCEVGGMTCGQFTDLASKTGMQYAAPFTFLSLRYVFGVICLIPWLLLSRPRWPADRRE